MKFPLYPIVLIAVVVIVGGVALWRQLPVSDTVESSSADVRELDGDGDFDGDPIETPDTSVSEGEGEEIVTPAPTPSPAPSPTPHPTPTPPAPTPSGYTMAQVRAHASAESCWTAVSGSVYDLTSWIAKHPGGKSAILRMCGTDGTQTFNAQHGGQARPERELASFKIGALI